MAIVAAAVLVLDQLTKLAVLKYLGYAKEMVVIDSPAAINSWLSSR